MKPLKKILYVEDEADIREVAVMALEMVGGFELKVCESGADAIDVASAYAPDLLLLDVMMPQMDGPATLKRLREIPQTANVPVIFMTAKVQHSEIAAYHQMGALGVIAKPFEPMTLADEIRKIWDRQ